MSKKIKILFVEHESYDLEMMYRELKKSGVDYTFETVQDEQNYLNKLEEFVPDIILSDYSLPTFSGLRAFELRQEIAANTPFIFVSGTIGEEKSIELIKNGVTDYVLKDKIFSLVPKIQRALKEFEERLSKRQAEVIIEFERNNLKALINNTNDLMWSVDRSFNLITSNQGFDEMVKKIAGTSISPGTGRNLKATNNKLLKRFKAYYERAFAGEIFTEIEYVSTPVESWAEISFYPIRRGNEIVGTACHSRDITNIKKTERKISANEKRFRALVESGADSVAILSAEGKPIYVSPTIEKVLGYTEAEALQLDLFSLFHQDDIGWAIEVWQQILAMPNFPFPVRPSRVMHKDGNWRWLEGTLTNFLNDEAINGIVDNFRDVTERKKAKDLLLLTQFAVDNAGDAIFWMTTDAKIANVNDAACSMLGYSKHELQELSIPDIDNAYQKEKWQQHFIELRKKGSLFFETTHKTKTGKIIPVEIRANYIQYDGIEYNCAFSRDITERKKTEEVIRKSEAFNRGVIDSLSAHIAVLDENGFIVTVNDAWNQFGLENGITALQGSGVGSNYFKVCKKAVTKGNTAASYALQGIKDVMQEKEPCFYFEYECHSPKEQRWFAMRVVKFKSETPMAIVAHENITEHKKTKAERDTTQEANITLQKIKQELQKALTKEKDLNELKSRFVSMASHEFRTPLTTMMSSLSLVNKYAELNDTKSQQKHIIKIKKSINNLTDILDDFLSISKLEEGKIQYNPETINLKNFIEDIVTEMQLMATDGQTIAQQYNAKQMVLIDKKLLKNILFNLLSNALKFSKHAGRVEVFVNETHELVSIAVKDYGIGISEGDQKHLFERFFRGHNATHIQGTGLGLNIVAKYTELMNANLSFESVENNGTTFLIKIPK